MPRDRRTARRLALLLLALLTSAGCAGGSSSSQDSGPLDDAPSGGDGSLDGDASTLSDLERLQALVAALPGAAAPATLVDEFFAAVTYGEAGLPIRQDGKLAFAFLANDENDYVVAGDFNDWSKTADPLLQPRPGFPFYYRIVDAPTLPARSLYKLIVDGVTYFPDPLARRFGYDEFGEYSMTGPDEATSHDERWPAFADHAGTLAPRRLVVHVPAGYAASTARLPVLYFHDGQNLFGPGGQFGSWGLDTTVDSLIAGGTLQRVLVVGIDNTPARMDEYTHVTDQVGGTTVGGKAAEYADFVALGVKPFIDARYRTRPERAGTAVVGSSLGGLVSLYTAWRHPTVFAYAGSLSGTLGWGKLVLANATMSELYTMTPPSELSIYLDSGGAGECPDASDNFCENVAMRDTLLNLGWKSGVNLTYVYAPNAQHTEAAWAARIGAVLAAWF